jgi:alpha-D-xyloside xylohydrolase
VPWLFDEESVDVLRHFTRLKNELFPYLFAAAHDAHERGWPVMRAMVLEYPSDPACLYLDRQYMLGDALLVAPVFSENGVVDYYLPKGRWTSLLENRVVEGGQWRRERLDFFNLPLFVRENSIVPTAASSSDTGWLSTDELVLQLFEIADGATTTTNVFASDTRQPTTFRCRRAGRQFVLERFAGDASRVRVLLRNPRGSREGLALTIEAITNGQLMRAGTAPPRRTAQGILIEWAEASAPITFTLAESPVEVSPHRIPAKAVTNPS